MREIKFRAWDEEKKEMIYSYPLWQTIADVWSAVMFAGHHPDELSELMQYTGLKDKNGKEIYEGDIVRIAKTYNGDYSVKEYNAKVYFDYGGFNVTGDGSFDTFSVNNGYWEVIGNIYENGELMNPQSNG